MREKNLRKKIRLIMISMFILLLLCGCGEKNVEPPEVSLTLTENTTESKKETTAKETKREESTEKETTKSNKNNVKHTTAEQTTAEQTTIETEETEFSTEEIFTEATTTEKENEDFIEGVGLISINGKKIEANDSGLFIDDILSSKGEIRSTFVTDGNTIYYVKVLEYETAIYKINIDGSGEERIYTREDGMEIGYVFACKEDILYFMMNIPGDTISNCYTWKIGSNQTTMVLESISNPYLYDGKIYWTSYVFDVSPVTLYWADIDDFEQKEISSQVGKYKIFEDKIYYSNMIWNTANDGYKSEIMRCDLDGANTEVLSDELDVIYDFEVTHDYVIYKKTEGTTNLIYKRDYDTQDEVLVMESDSHIELVDVGIGIYMIEMNQESGIHNIYKFNESDNTASKVKEIQLQSGHSFYISTIGDGYILYQEYDADYNMLGMDEVYF